MNGHRAMQAMVIVGLALGLTAAAHGQLVGFYEFEGNADDSSGLGNDGFITGNPFSSSGGGLFGDYAFQNDGSTGQYVWVPLQISPAVAQQVTIGGWVNINGTGYQSILQSDGHYGRGLHIDDRGLDPYAGSDGTWNYAAHGGRSIGVAEDDWHIGRTGSLAGDSLYGYRAVVQGDQASASDGWVFFAATYDAGRGETTVYSGNNVYKQVDSYPFNPTDDARGLEPLHIGSIKGLYENIDGRIDNVFVFDGALTPAQMASLRNASDPLATAQAIGSDIASAKNRTWKVDFNPTSASYFNSLPTGAGGNETWNWVSTGAENLGWPGYSPSIDNMVDTEGNHVNPSNTDESPDFAVSGIVGSYSYGAVADPAAGDYMTWGDFGGLNQSITWELSDLDPDKVYKISQIGGGVFDKYAENNERRRFTMSVDTDGDGSSDTTRLIKMVRGAAIGIIARPSATGSIVGANGHGGDAGLEANWGGFMVEELGSADDDKFKLRCSPRHRYSFDINPQLGASVVYDSVGAAHGTTYDTDGTTVVSDLQLGDGTMDLSFDPQDGPWGLAKLPTSIMDGKVDISIETWFTYTGTTGSGAETNTVLWNFKGSGSESFQQMATGQSITQYSFSPDFYHNVRLRSDEGGMDADVFTGDNIWGYGDEQHIVVTLETGAGANNTNILSYYLNGMLIKQALTDVNLSDIEFTELLLGGVPNVPGFFSNGIWEEFRIYDFALTENEILGNWMNGADALNVMQYMLGDVDRDGDVDNVDIGIATGNFTGSIAGGGRIWCDGDMDGDGDIDNQDIGMITGAFTGSLTLAQLDSISAATGLSTAELADLGLVTIPEPTTLTLLGLGAWAAVRRKRAA